jgi:hypothetical protein
MKKLSFFLKSKYTVIFSYLIIIFFVFSNNIFAAVMQSSTYKIQSDTVNFGGAPGASFTYKINDTLGEVGTGNSNSSTYYMHAGYWQMGESYISITSPSDLAMASMSGLSGGSSEGTISWTVLTDNTAGYYMTVNSSTTPALKSAQDVVDDYIPAGANPDYNFVNPSNTSSFGFTPEGADIAPRFKDNGSVCNTGSSDTASKCWDSLSTIPKQIVNRTTSNIPSGSVTTLRLRAESGVDHVQTSGAYSATITVTAVTL